MDGETIQLSISLIKFENIQSLTYNLYRNSCASNMLKVTPASNIYKMIESVNLTEQFSM